jgi:hypothetical protein
MARLAGERIWESALGNLTLAARRDGVGHVLIRTAPNATFAPALLGIVTGCFLRVRPDEKALRDPGRRWGSHAQP